MPFLPIVGRRLRSRRTRNPIVDRLCGEVVQVLGSPDDPVGRGGTRSLIGLDRVLEIGLSRASPIGRGFDRIVECWVSFHG